MFKFLAGVGVGILGTMYYSKTVRENVKECNEEIKELMRNRELLEQFTKDRIMEMYSNGELEQAIRQSRYSGAEYRNIID